MKKQIFFLSLMLTFSLIGPRLWAESADTRITDLEKRLESIQRTYFKNNAEVASAIANSHTVQEEFKALKGAVDANRHMVSVQRQDLERMISDLEHRLTSIEDRLEIFSTQITAALKKVAPDIANEGELYQKGLDKFNAGEYLGAAATFQSFIKKFPKSSLMINAQFWIGECFYAVKDFKRAIKEFQNVINKSEQHEKGITALKKQGDCFYEMGLFEESKVFYEKVEKEFPASAEALQAKNKIGLINQKQKEKQEIKTPEEPEPTSYPTETIQQQQEKFKATEPEPVLSDLPEEETEDKTDIPEEETEKQFEEF
ncbi:MAG: tol-pal system protein YbgF [Pseudomonadota bacterium]